MSSWNTARGRPCMRDRVLLREMVDLEKYMPDTCKIVFPDPETLCDFLVEVKPSEGFYVGGKFVFNFKVPEDYNLEPPAVVCTTRMWHPNISEDGAVCLSILRLHTYDGMGWSPVQGLKEVIWGINSLFTDLLNFEEPLNSEAAEMYKRSPEEFKMVIQKYIYLYGAQ